MASVVSEISDIAPKVLNFSRYDPNPAELSILNMGPKFCPTPNKPDYLQLEVDINEFIRKIKLASFFNFATQYVSDCLLHKKSDYRPPDSRDPILYSLVKHIKEYAKTVYKLPTPKVYDNISVEERAAIYSLKNNRNIVILSVDKGSTVVILDRCDYVNYMESYLRDTNTYRKLPGNLDNKILASISKFTAKYKHSFDQSGKEQDFLINFDHKPANFYGLPKIHKSQIIKNTIKHSSSSYIKMDFPSDLPFRGIQGGVISPTSKLSEFLDLLLKPFCCKINSHIRDYVDFLNKLPAVEKEVFHDSVLITCDVVNMYNNIDTNLGLKAIKYWLNKFPELLHHRFQEEFVLEGLELVLKNSTFQFNGEHFALLKGTATGTTVAPTYATLVMAYLEVDLYSNVKHHFGEEVCQYFILNWKRFLDDCFILWRKSFGDFNVILDILNNLDHNLCFTCEQSDSGLPFLNLFLYKDNTSKCIKADMYYKDTDSHDYLPFRSCHPRHIKVSIPGNLARMICTIVDDPSRKITRLQELKQWLRKCGYPRRLVGSKINQFQHKDTNFLRNKLAHDKDTNLLVFIQMHNPKNPYVFNYLRNAFNSLIAVDKFARVFNNTKLIKSVRQPPNLGRLLQKHNIFFEDIPNGCKKCTKSNCGTCPYIEETNMVYFKNVKTGVETNFQLLRSFDCKSKNVIYKITCKECSQFYIGQTGQTLHGRVTGHKSKLRYATNRNQRVYIHLHMCAVKHNPNYNPLHSLFRFSIVPFYYVTQATVTARLTIEDYFYRKFGPTLNGY